MSVREPGYDPRRTHPRSGAHPAGTRPPRHIDVGGPVRGSGLPGPRSRQGGSRTPAIAGALGVVALVVVVGLGFGSGLIGGQSSVDRSPSPSPSLTGLASGAPGTPIAGAPGQSGEPGASGGPIASDDPGTPPLVEADVAIVPVTSFRAARTATRPADIAAIADGGSPFKALVLVEADADAILDALRIGRAELGKRFITVASADALAKHLADHRTRVGFLRADEIGPSVKALGWGPRSLFGVDRVTSLADWPLTARLLAPATPAYDPAGAWTLVAGGDILLDRGVKLAIDASSRGAAFPFDGGTVEITGRCKDCSPMGWDLPYTKRTGNKGAVRDLLTGADLAIANFENPAPNNWRWHASGTTFSADPALIDGLAKAGIDWVSLANNHIGDAGRTGMLQTMKNLDRRGIAHGGLGRTYAKAHEATLLEAGGVTVGILGYDQILAGYNADADTPGSARMTRKALRADIRAARAAGADVVIVFPHWGVEYRAEPTDGQQTMAHVAINAGADMVIGNHPHWAQGMEVYKGKPIWYGLGNFVFDQTWSEYTMEGLTLELTFHGNELVQVRMRPHLLLGKAQPNFMDPAGFGGKFVMDQVWGASEGRLPW